MEANGRLNDGVSVVSTYSKHAVPSASPAIIVSATKSKTWETLPQTMRLLYSTKSIWPILELSCNSTIKIMTSWCLAERNINPNPPNTNRAHQLSTATPNADYHFLRINTDTNHASSRWEPWAGQHPTPKPNQLISMETLLPIELTNLREENSRRGNRMMEEMKLEKPKCPKRWERRAYITYQWETPWFLSVAIPDAWWKSEDSSVERRPIHFVCRSWAWKRMARAVGSQVRSSRS